MVRFTDNYIKNLKPKEKRDEKYEGGGFGIFIYPTGSKTWIYRYKIDNKKDYIILGHYPTMSLSEAKKRYIDLHDMRRIGVNPKEVVIKEQEQRKNTVKELMLSWYSNYIERHRKQPLQIKQQIDADIIPMLGHKELHAVQARDITRELDKIVKRGSPVHANKVLSTLKQAFNYAVSRGEAISNPAMNIRARDIGGQEKPRDRNLDLDEIKQLWLFLDSNNHSMSIQIKNAIKIILLTGVRSGELRLAKWSEFNFDKSLWIIPAQNNKIGVNMKIHLSELTKTLLLEIKEMSLSNFVLTGKNDNSLLADKSIAKAIQRIQERVGIAQWTTHDLRRSFATQLGETLRIDPVVIEKCLGHKMPKIMATYNKDEMLHQRKEALDKWSHLIQELTKFDFVQL